MWRRALAMAGTVAVLITATSTSVASAVPIGDTAAGRAVAVLADPQRSGRDLVLPTGFPSVMGYLPAEESGPGGLALAVRTDATCSSPFGGTRYGFDQACRVHDLGYDLLRYAAKTGQPLGSSARKALDAAFGERMRERCRTAFDGLDRVSCVFVAGTYEGAVVANSWRQGFAAPRPDPLWAALAPGGAVLMLGLAGLATRVRPRLRRLPTLPRIR
jgi:hypothetical protein